MEQYSNSATLQLINLGSGISRSITACLAALVDGLAQKTVDSSKLRTMILVADGHAEVHSRNRAGGHALVARIEYGPGGLAPELKPVLKRTAGKDVHLRIGSDRAVVKQISLPLAALDVLPAVVRNKIESLAPWPLQEVIWGYGIAHPPRQGQASVNVGIVSRKAADRLLDDVRRAGAKIRYLDIGKTAGDGAGIAIDFQGPERAAKARRFLIGVMSAFAMAALGVMANGLYLAVNTQTELSAVEQRIADLKEALLGRRGGRETNPKLDQANKLYDRKKDDLPVVLMLNALTGLVPDGTWLTAIDYSSNQVTITGKGTSITKVIESLEASDIFANVNFASATQRDAELNADVFSISAAVEKRGRPQ